MAQFPDEQSDEGEFERQEDAFRDWVSDNPDAKHPAARNRYQLYISLACPWASRALIVRNLKVLDSVIGLSIADPVRDDRGWAFREGPGHVPDAAEHFEFLREAYRLTQPDFSGRVTVPVLWDKQARVIVNNSEDDICRMFNDAFGRYSDAAVNLFPAEIAAEQQKLSDWIYERVNNGVYRAGFASSQAAYEKAARLLFDALDELELRLLRSRYLFGSTPVETDWRLFCTLVRFDAVYHGHFKCNVRRIFDYPNLSGYLRDLYQRPGLAATVNLDHIKRHYYFTHDDINPTRIVPIGPVLDFDAPHGREKLG
jgi:putative glutathione S-transferase